MAPTVRKLALQRPIRCDALIRADHLMICALCKSGR